MVKGLNQLPDDSRQKHLLLFNLGGEKESYRENMREAYEMMHGIQKGRGRTFPLTPITLELEAT